jgi:hypothetical protein
MRPKIDFPEGTADRMEKLLKQAKDISEFKRVQCIYFRAKLDYDAGLISKITGYKLQTVRNIHSSFLKYGEKALNISKKGGRYNELLTLKKYK